MTVLPEPFDRPPEPEPAAPHQRLHVASPARGAETGLNAEAEPPPGPARELQRQQLLLQSLLRHAPSTAALPAWLQGPPERQARGLQAYRANADAGAERALAATFPAVAQLVSAESFAALARAYRQARPPQRGDLAWLGEQLPAFIATDPQLADAPYLADVARLEWLLDQAERAADTGHDPNSLLVLADANPAALRLQLAPGAALLHSRWPVVAIYQAQVTAEAEAEAAPEAAAATATATARNAEAKAARAGALARARAALERGEGESALVWRPAFKAQVCALGPPQARFVAAVLQGRSLAQALDDAGDGFSFESWLTWALQQGVLRGAVRCSEQPASVGAGSAGSAGGAGGAPGAQVA